MFHMLYIKIISGVDTGFMNAPGKTDRLSCLKICIIVIVIVIVIVIIIIIIIIIIKPW